MTSDQYILGITTIQNRLYAYILSLLADPVAAQDVLQETNLVLIRKSDDFQNDASFESWAYNTARFQVLAHLRDRKRDRLVLHEAFAEKLAPVAEVMAEETERRVQLLGGCGGIFTPFRVHETPPPPSPSCIDGNRVVAPTDSAAF